MPFSEVFRLHARLRARKVAIRQGERSIDFISLDRAVNGTAFAFRDLGIKRGDIVGVALKDSPEHLIALLALARIGAIILPMDWRWSSDEQRAVADRYTAHLVLMETLPENPPSGWRAITPGMFAGTDRVYMDAEVTDESPFLLSLSSGTTGMPKGPCVTHRQFESRFMPYWLNLTMNANDRFVLATPLYHGGGRGFTLAMIFAGATVSLFPPPYEPEELVAHVAAVDGTAIFLVPTILRRLLDNQYDGLAFPSMRKLISSGSALYREERMAVRERLTPNLFEIYSSTEGGAVSITSPEDMLMAPESVGRPAFRVDVEIVDEEHQPLPVGEVGRLRYRSPASPKGYFVGDSNEAFRDGWFYPGDLAMIDTAGFVYLKGRVKDMIIRGGMNIYPGDIEKVLLECNGVSDAAVIGTPSREFGEELAAFVVSASGVTRDSLVAHCKAKLAPYKVPRRVLFIDKLPRNSSGKIIKADLERIAADAQ